MSSRGQGQFEDYALLTQRISASTLIKSGAGFLSKLTLSQLDAAPTAGSIFIYDNTSAAGTCLWSHVQTTAVFMPVTVTLDMPFNTGLYVSVPAGMTDVSLTLAYK